MFRARTRESRLLPIWALASSRVAGEKNLYAGLFPIHGETKKKAAVRLPVTHCNVSDDSVLWEFIATRLGVSVNSKEISFLHFNHFSLVYITDNMQ